MSDEIEIRTRREYGPGYVRVLARFGYYEELVSLEGIQARLVKRRDSKNYYIELMLEGVECPRPTSLKTSDLQKAIELAREKYRDAIRRVIREEPLGEPLMKDLLDAFIRWQRERVIKKEFEHNRIRRHRSISVNHILPLLGHRHLSSLTTEDAAKFQRERLKSGAKPSTVATDVATLRDWARFGMERGYRKIPLVAPVKHADPVTVESSWFEPEEMRRLRNALRHEDPVLRNLVLFLYHTGCRPTEAGNLRFEDVIPHKPRGGAPSVRLRLRGKGKNRVIPVLPVVRTIVERMAAHHGRRTGQIFPDVKRLSERFRYFLLKEGLYYDAEGNRRRLYSLRHTRATQELLRGQVPAVLAGWMGHTIEIQQRVYSKVLKVVEQEGLMRRGRGR
ncbi:tyrosine-type recombinase/integrase [Azospirillum sp. RWY-5-1]|uniref:Tyrosine-type recombinase/integrase n=1 Tax=Azospirillum oleiclasticum TaxID=2735135 RepID=A0ABX2T6A5_9PROT|nr:tyrosine-type recombinase/integrase [Azospirillum oleiclasticum]NYZ11582.1 tyrosine-type recombinase/integrase [Azospirillum oleiclasticum]NYZ18743.1 tyrosine-type recombinase/integrase [Azospirillum oleiclasticum]